MVCHMVCGKWHMVCGHCQKCRESYVKSFQTMGDRTTMLHIWSYLFGDCSWKITMVCRMVSGKWHMVCGHCQKCREPYVKSFQTMGMRLMFPRIERGCFFSMEVPKTKWNKESVTETGLWKPEAAVPWLWNWCTVPCWSRYIWYILYISCIWGLLDGSESESWDIRKTCLIANVMWPVEEGGVRAAFNSQTWRRWQEGPGT